MAQHPPRMITLRTFGFLGGGRRADSRVWQTGTLVSFSSAGCRFCSFIGRSFLGPGSLHRHFIRSRVWTILSVYGFREKQPPCHQRVAENRMVSRPWFVVGRKKPYAVRHGCQMWTGFQVVNGGSTRAPSEAAAPCPCKSASGRFRPDWTPRYLRGWRRRRATGSWEPMWVPRCCRACVR